MPKTEPPVKAPVSKEKTSILDNLPKSIKSMPSYIKAHPIKGAAIIAVTVLAVGGLAAAAVFTGGGAMAIAGAVAAGVIGSGALAAGASSHGREQEITGKLRNIQRSVSVASSAVKENAVNAPVRPDLTPPVKKTNEKQQER